MDYLTTRLNVLWADKAFNSEGYDGPVREIPRVTDKFDLWYLRDQRAQIIKLALQRLTREKYELLTENKGYR